MKTCEFRSAIAFAIGEITRGARAITADTDLLLSPYFGTSGGY